MSDEKNVVQDVVETAAEQAEEGVETMKRVDPRVLSRISSDTGQGFMALSVAIWAGTFAYNKFRVAYVGRKAITSTPQ